MSVLIPVQVYLVSITDIWGLFDLSLAQLIKYLYLRTPRGINICICNILEDNLIRNQGLNIYPIRHSVSAFHWTTCEFKRRVQRKESSRNGTIMCLA